MPNYTPAPEVEQIAQGIIGTHRQILGHLKIAYVFRDKAPVSDGKITAGMCRRVDDLNHTLHDHDFVIEISKDLWEEIGSDEFKQALVDHELGHCGIRMDESGDVLYDERTNRPKTYVKKHDIEEFADVLFRHGAYHEELRNFIQAFADRQLAKKGKSKSSGTDGEEGLGEDAVDAEDAGGEGDET